MSSLFKKFGLTEIVLFFAIQIVFVTLTGFDLYYMNDVQSTKPTGMIDFRWFVNLLVQNTRIINVALISKYQLMLRNEGFLPEPIYHTLSPTVKYDPKEVLVTSVKKNEVHLMAIDRYYTQRTEAEMRKLYALKAPVNLTLMEGRPMRRTYSFSTPESLRVIYQYMSHLENLVLQTPPADLNSLILADYEYLVSDDYFSLGSIKLIVSLLADDEKTYLGLVAQLETLFACSIAAWVVLWLCIAGLLYRIRSKIVRIYRCFLAVQSAEVDFFKVQSAALRRKAAMANFDRDPESDEQKSSDMSQASYFDHYGSVQMAKVRRRSPRLPWHRTFGLLFSFAYFLIIAAAVGTAVFTVKNTQRSANLALLRIMTINRYYGRLPYTGSHMISKIYQAVIAKAALRSTGFSFNSSRTYARKLLDNFELNLGLVNSQASIDQVFGYSVVTKPMCIWVDVKLWNMTQSDCEQLADGLMGRSMVAALGWMRQTFTVIFDSLDNDSGPDLLKMLQSKTFEQLEFLANIVLTDFMKVFCEGFYPRMHEYHRQNVKMSLYYLIMACICTFTLCLLAAVFASLFVWRQVRTAEKGLDIIPYESFEHNKLMKVALNQIHIF